MTEFVAVEAFDFLQPFGLLCWRFGFISASFIGSGLFFSISFWSLVLVCIECPALITFVTNLPTDLAFALDLLGIHPNLFGLVTVIVPFRS